MGKLFKPAEQRRRGICSVGGGKLKDFPIKFKTFIFTNSKSSKIFQRSIKISKDPTMSKKFGGHGPLSPLPLLQNHGVKCRKAIKPCRVQPLRNPEFTDPSTSTKRKLLISTEKIML